LHEEFKRRDEAQTVLPSADTAAMLFEHCLLADVLFIKSGTNRLATDKGDQRTES